METISTKIHKAKKEHTCNFCLGLILVGEKYKAQFNNYDGNVYTWKSHLYCCEIASKLKMYDECDEGVTDEDFYEYISNEYNEVVDENDTTIHSFKEKLDIVLSHHNISKS